MKCKHYGKAIVMTEGEYKHSSTDKYHCKMTDGWWCGKIAEPEPKEQTVKRLLNKLV